MIAPMKADTYTKIFLTVIALLLGVIAFRPAPVRAAPPHEFYLVTANGEQARGVINLYVGRGWEPIAMSQSGSEFNFLFKK
jgi:hypothetical protein